MQTQNITIENNTGTINFYNSDDGKKSSETVTIAAVDKYSTPLRAEIEMTPWGENMHRVSFLMKNDLLGQVLQQNYLTYKDEEKAKKVYAEVVDSIREFKNKAEKGHIHSAILVPLIWHKMASFDSDIKDPISDDLRIRFMNPETHKDFMGATPRGLLLHPVEDHFPTHGGLISISGSKEKFKIVGVGKFGELILEKIDGFQKKASKKVIYLNAMRKEAKQLVASFEKISKQWDRGIFDAKEFITHMSILPWDSDSRKTMKRKALLKIRPMMISPNPVKWAQVHKDILEEAVVSMGESAFDSMSQKKQISVKDYDLFIFDADQTLWDGVPAYKMEPPYERHGDTLADRSGQEVTLKEGIRETLVSIREMGKDIGLISKSEKMGVEYQDQPVILMLKEYGLLDLFNEMIVIDNKMPKSAFIPKDSRAVFIDDDVENLTDVQEHSNADAMDADVVEFDQSDILDFDSDLEPLEVIEMREGERMEDLEDWVENDDEILIPIKDNVVLKARIRKEREIDPMYDPEHDDASITATNENWYKVSKKQENVEYVEVTNNFGPSGSMAAFFGIEKEDNKLWIPKSRVKDYEEQCKEIEEDLAAGKTSSLKNWYKEAERDYIPVSERPEKPHDGKEYQLDHKKPRHKGGSDTKDNLQWVEKDKHEEKSREEGSFKDGGDKKINQEKTKGKSSFHEYQKDCGSAKQAKDREELGEAGYSAKQSEIAKARWAKEKK